MNVENWKRGALFKHRGAQRITEGHGGKGNKIPNLCDTPFFLLILCG
jgi:hypothetical protein